jgi:hypothetical protein
MVMSLFSLSTWEMPRMYPFTDTAIIPYYFIISLYKSGFTLVADLLPDTFIIIYIIRLKSQYFTKDSTLHLKNTSVHRLISKKKFF